MRYVSWNVNGLRAVMGKNFTEAFNELDADAFCLQETKLQEGQIEMDLPGYRQYWNYAEKKGYSGTAIFTKNEPISVSYGIGVEEHDHEGRVITLEFDDHYLITVYVPNSQDGLKRLDYRMEWEDAFLSYIRKLDKKKPVIYCGDFLNAGFTDEERAKFGAVLNAGFIDSFRYFYPEQADIYSWWSYRMQARTRNAGWRIDYFVVSERLRDRLVDAKIHTEIMGSEDRLVDAKIHTDIMGSDHCPVELEFK